MLRETSLSSLGHRRSRGFGLAELLIVIAVVGLISAVLVPAVRGVLREADDVKTQKNAKEIASLSSALASAGVAHVIPDAMGGVSATVRLLNEGVVVPDGPYRGQVFRIQGLTDDEIDRTVSLLNVVYDYDDVSLEYVPSGN